MYMYLSRVRRSRPSQPKKKAQRKHIANTHDNDAEHDEPGHGDAGRRRRMRPAKLKYCQRDARRPAHAAAWVNKEAPRGGHAVSAAAWRAVEEPRTLTTRCREIEVPQVARLNAEDRIDIVALRNSQSRSGPSFG